LPLPVLFFIISANHLIRMFINNQCKILFFAGILLLFRCSSESRQATVYAENPNIIRKILLDNLPLFEKCNNKTLRKSSTMVPLHFTIGPSGHVTYASIDEVTDSLSSENRDCVLKVIRGIKFPEPSGGGVVEVNQPMNFEKTSSKQSD